MFNKLVLLLVLISTIFIISAEVEKCEDRGCAESFQGDGVCVDTALVNWATLDSDYDIEAGVKDDQCSRSCNCHCLKKKMCPIVPKSCLKKKGQCISPESRAREGWYYAGFLCDQKSKCKCYRQCKSNKCSKQKGICLITATDEIPLGFKKKGVCNKKAGCDCYVPSDECNSLDCSLKGGKCYKKGQKVPGNAQYLGWCSKTSKCKCYKSRVCSDTQIEIPEAVGGGRGQRFCLDTDRILLMRDYNGQVEGYTAEGACGLNSIPATVSRWGGGLAFVEERLISFGGWLGGYGQPDTFEFNFNTNSWIKVDDMPSASHLSYYGYTQTAIGHNSTTGKEVAYYFGSPELYIFNPDITDNPWSLKMTDINLWTMGVVGVGYDLIIIDGKSGSVIRYNTRIQQKSFLKSLPVAEDQCYYPKAAILKRSSGVGIMVVCSNGDTWFCLLDDLESTPSWNKLTVVDGSVSTYGTMLAYVEGTMHCLRGPKSWKWDDAHEKWVSAPEGYSAWNQKYARTTYASVPKGRLSGC